MVSGHVRGGSSHEPSGRIHRPNGRAELKADLVPGTLSPTELARRAIGSAWKSEGEEEGDLHDPHASRCFRMIRHETSRRSVKTAPTLRGESAPPPRRRLRPRFR